MSTNEPEKIVILNFRSGQVLVLDYDSNLYEDPDEFFDREEMADIPIKDCEYMVTMAKDLQILFSTE